MRHRRKAEKKEEEERNAKKILKIKEREKGNRVNRLEG
jgi:hypothetical protein